MMIEGPRAPAGPPAVRHVAPPSWAVSVEAGGEGRGRPAALGWGGEKRQPSSQHSIALAPPARTVDMDSRPRL